MPVKRITQLYCRVHTGRIAWDQVGFEFYCEFIGDFVLLVLFLLNKTKISNNMTAMFILRRNVIFFIVAT